MSENFDAEAFKAKIEAELREKMMAEIKENAVREFVSRAESLVTVANIAKELGSVETTVKGVITGANIKPVMKIGRSEFYERADIVKAYANKHANLLSFLGLVHEVKDVQP